TVRERLSPVLQPERRYHTRAQPPVVERDERVRDEYDPRARPELDANRAVDHVVARVRNVRALDDPVIRLVDLERLGERDPLLVDLERRQQVDGECGPRRKPVIESEGELDVAARLTAAVQKACIQVGRKV